MVQVQFATQTGFISAAIRAFTWSPVSHVDIVLPGGLPYGNGRVTKEGDLVGARFAQDKGLNKGVSVRPNDYGTFSKVIIAQADISPEVAFTVYEAALAQTGKPYDLTGIINFALHRNWREDDSFFCSELVAWAFEQAGYPLLDGDVYRITPRDLLLSPLLKVISTK